LPLPEGTIGGQASSINDAGIVLGGAYNSDYSVNLVAWKAAVVAGEWVVQKTLTIASAPEVGSVYGLPMVVNSGYVGATLYLSDFRALRLKLAWDADEVWEVADSRTQPFDDYSTANGINEAGTICGRRADPSGSGWGIA
jgi:hypothetical protein